MSYFCPDGEMAEWSNAAVLKTVVRSRGPGVRIPLSPQIYRPVVDESCKYLIYRIFHADR